MGGSDGLICGGCGGCADSEGTELFRATERRFGLGGEFALIRCRRCGLVRTEPQPRDMGAYYPARDYYSYRPPRRPSSRAVARAESAYRPVGAGHLRRITTTIGRSRLMPGLPPGPPGELLDVGCGSGETLLVLSEVGWRCHGIEIDADAVDAARSAGLSEVRQGDLLDAEYAEGQFDAVRFWHSLEHVQEPRAELMQARRVLRVGGSLTIGVPNFGSLLTRLFKDRSFYLDVPRHRWHFDLETLPRLVVACGFRVTRIRLASGSEPLLGTVASVAPSLRRATGSRAVWIGVLPLAVVLDRVRLGDAIELNAVRES